MGSTSGVIRLFTPSKKYIVYFSRNQQLAAKRNFFIYWIDSLQNGHNIYKNINSIFAPIQFSPPFCLSHSCNTLPRIIDSGYLTGLVLFFFNFIRRLSFQTTMVFLTSYHFSVFILSFSRTVVLLLPNQSHPKHQSVNFTSLKVASKAHSYSS